MLEEEDAEASWPKWSLSWSLSVSVLSLALVGEGSDRFGSVDSFFCVCPGGKREGSDFCARWRWGLGVALEVQ